MIKLTRNKIINVLNERLDDLRTQYKEFSKEYGSLSSGALILSIRINEVERTIRYLNYLEHNDEEH